MNIICWICYAEETAPDSFNGDEYWISPCNCTGSLRWVHSACLSDRLSSILTNSDLESSSNIFECGNCLSDYKTTTSLPLVLANSAVDFKIAIKKVYYVSFITTLASTAFLVLWMHGALISVSICGPERFNAFIRAHEGHFTASKPLTLTRIASVFGFLFIFPTLSILNFVSYPALLVSSFIIFERNTRAASLLSLLFLTKFSYSITKTVSHFQNAYTSTKPLHTSIPGEFYSDTELSSIESSPQTTENPLTFKNMRNYVISFSKHALLPFTSSLVGYLFFRKVAPNSTCCRTTLGSGLILSVYLVGDILYQGIVNNAIRCITGNKFTD